MTQDTYIETIFNTLNMLYKFDYDIIKDHNSRMTSDNRLKNKIHEQTISFRIAHYLATQLECNSKLFIDCEYHRNIYSQSGYKEYEEKNGVVKRVRPDIIYHDRGATHNQNNEFVIEIKWGDNISYDKRKVRSLVNYLNFREGYCIYSFNNDSVNLYRFKASKCVDYKLKYDFIGKTFPIPAEDKENM